METKFLPYKLRKSAERHAPWAAKIVKVEGGYLAFRSQIAYETWRNQK